uniref:Uncharacterized protein n=1 Tax=Arundo donax TaxID=35708 RepID=A0A0A9U897_ARUDO
MESKVNPLFLFLELTY